MNQPNFNVNNSLFGAPQWAETRASIGVAACAAYVQFWGISLYEPNTNKDPENPTSAAHTAAANFRDFY